VLKPGDSIGAYRILGELGRGGMARVYRALQVSLDREVALKALSSDLAGDPQFLQRFTQEAHAVARLHHPNIVSIYDYGEQDDTPFIVMELVEGGTLKTMLGEPMDLQQAAPLIADVAAALDYAHRLGIIHRDVKPHNILIAPDGHAVLSDFGIAKLASAATQLTRTGASIGTPEYMSPEQVKGETATAASDIYSLGIVAFELATGRVPFSGDTPFAVMLKHVQEKAPPARQFKATLPAALEPVLAKALAIDAADRYVTAMEFSRAFTAAAQTADPAETVVMTVPVQSPGPAVTVVPLPPADAAATLIERAASPGASYPSTIPAAAQAVPAPPAPPPGRTGRTVASGGGLTLTMTPQKLGRSQATYGLVLRNDRAEATEMTLHAAGHDTCEFTVPEKVVVPANAETAVQLGVRSSRRRWRGPAEKREFNLAAMAGGAAPMVVTGEFEDRPRNAMVAVGGAFAGLLLLVGLPAGVVLSRGGGDSNNPAATDATSTPSATQGNAVATATATATPAAGASQSQTAPTPAQTSPPTPTGTPAPATPTTPAAPTATAVPPTSTRAPTPSPVPTVAFQVTSVLIHPYQDTVTQSCSSQAQMYFVGDIFTSAPGTVAYHFVRSDGAVAQPETVAVGTGPVSVAYSWFLAASYTGWVALVIDSPNALTSAQANFKLTCT
jgi:serine/threonine-protein kinase